MLKGRAKRAALSPIGPCGTLGVRGLGGPRSVTEQVRQFANGSTFE